MGCQTNRAKEDLEWILYWRLYFICNHFSVYRLSLFCSIIIDSFSKQENDLTDLTDSTYKDYYLATRNLEDAMKLPFDIKSRLLAFFDTYEDYFPFKILRIKNV